MRNYDSSDPLYLWKKHSGFKKGLETDIILGDSRKWKQTNRFETTMEKDYNASNSFALAADVNSQSVGNTSAVPTKTETHICFGDFSMYNPSRMNSLTSRDFQPPPPVAASTIHEQMLAKNNQSQIEKYHTKSLVETSYAHVGLQTRQNLPIDDKTFNNYSSSSADAYKDPHKNGMIQKNIQNFHPIPSNRLSNIPQGDAKNVVNYSTMNATSYVHHPKYHLSKSCKPIAGTHIIFGHTNERDVDKYTSTSKDDYKKQTLMGADHSFKAKNSKGVSSVHLGEHGKPLNSISVTMDDYSSHDKHSMAVAHQNAIKPPHKSPVSIALCPDSNHQWKDQESFSASSYKKASPSFAKPAGVSHGTKTKVNQISSIPQGDCTKFGIAECTSTATDFFNSYKYVPAIHPVLGAQMTRSKVCLGEPGGAHDALPKDQYSTTSQDAYISYGDKFERGISYKPTSTLRMADKNGQVYSMANNKTTNSDHFKGLFADKAQSIQGKLAAKNTLFALNPLQCGEYETVMSNSFAMRNGLEFSKEDYLKTKNQKSVLCQLGTKSCITLGDAHLNFFQRMPK